LKVYAAQDLQLTDHDFKDIVDTRRPGSLPSENDLTKRGETVEKSLQALIEAAGLGRGDVVI